jgi:hypothetical protein
MISPRHISPLKMGGGNDTHLYNQGAGSSRGGGGRVL